MSLLKKFLRLGNKKITAITIDGEYGSGANEIGAAVAQKLNINFYDEKTIELMSLESKVKPEDVTKDDSFLQGTIYDLYRENYSYSQEDITVSDAVFLMDSKTIRERAKKSPAVFVGKCADYVLGKENVLSVFIYGDLDLKKRRIEKEYGIKKDKIEAVMTKEDTRRSNHYRKNTGGRIWGQSCEYDVSFNSSSFDFEVIEEIIIKLYHSKK